MATATHTYQPTDLTTTKRREFLSEALAGVARIRLPDGETLVALPEHELDVLTEIRTYVVGYLQLQNVVARPREERLVTDLGEFAWASVLDDDDLREFARELSASLAVSLSSKSLERVIETVKAWKLTAELFADSRHMERVDGSCIEDEFDEMEFPLSNEEVV